MYKEKIIVPKGIRYIGEVNPETKERLWTGYNLEDYDFPHILNKKITGCGYTEYCIENSQNLILVSPRKFLLENKEEQHKGEIYYVKNEIETSVDFELDFKDDKKYIEEKSKDTDASKNGTVENLELLKINLRNAVRNWEKDNPGKPFKILVTYDSFRHVKDALKHFYWREEDHLGGFDDRFSEFQVVVDEFQSVFIDSRFKSDTEIILLNSLRDVKRVCYVSATPLLDKYLERLKEFKDLPYYELDWETDDPGRVKKPKLEIRFVVSSLSQAINGIIQNYKDGKFDTRINSETGKFIESKEAVFFLNSVASICQAIRTNNLHYDQVNVLCAHTTKNEDSVRKAFNDVLRKEAKKTGVTPITFKKKDKIIGKIPTKGQPHKMFTFCTRTVYLGADFYSTCARTFIFSDSNIQCLAVDISMDLEQILGRQRLDENPWKNTALMYVKCTDPEHRTTKEEYDEFLKRKTESSRRLLEVFRDAKEGNRWDLASKYQRDTKCTYYKYDYVAVSRIENDKGEVVKLQPVFNDLVLVTEERAFELQQVDYADRFTVFSSTKSEGICCIDDEVTQKVEEFSEVKTVRDRLKFLIKYSEAAKKEDFENFLELIPGKYKDYYLVVGPETITRCSYVESEIKKAWMEKIANEEIHDDVMTEIYGTFFVGKRYTKKLIKELLIDIYQRLGYKKKAKATDLEVYFYLKRIYTSDGQNGFEIVGRR